ncbi:glycoside hydrolase family 18 protein [Cristinia sonorae]|uniref:chitinase n=1 Tax=Cristinia sonorae TaxID=1940300 RepID=A0A8K0UJQ8_9AGAR|nr:glycoside hydrolase family 18 protein [Cristinia sonorae]
MLFLFKHLFASLALAITVLLAPSRVESAPASSLDGLDHQARSILARATPAAPHFVVYSDQWTGTTGPPATSQVKGWNVFVLSFLLLEGAWDQAQSWTQLSASQRSTIKSQYAAAGIKLMVSAFGSTDVPTSSGADPVATANTMAAWVKQYQLDGIDVDYEDFNAFDAGNGKAEQWLITFTQQLRAQLPAGQFIITHAPVAPWFAPSKWGGGGYLKVHQTVGNLIDWYNVQFYNQQDYTTCNSLLNTSGSQWPKSALFQIVASGVPASKIVIGKPATTADASDGFIAPATLAGCISQAKSQGWSGGVMSWEFPDASSSWIQTVRGSAFPV